MDVQVLWWLLLLHCYAGGGLAENASNHKEDWRQQASLEAGGDMEKHLNSSGVSTENTLKKNGTGRNEPQISFDGLGDKIVYNTKSRVIGIHQEAKLKIYQNNRPQQIKVPKEQSIASYHRHDDRLKSDSEGPELSQPKITLSNEAVFKLVTTKSPQVRRSTERSVQETIGNASWHNHWQPQVRFMRNGNNSTATKHSDQHLKDHGIKRTSVLSRGRRTDTEHSDRNTEQSGFYYTTKEREKLPSRDGSIGKSEWKEKSKSLDKGQWVEYDFDQSTSTTTTEDPNLPKNPVGLKNPNLLVGPWVEEPAVRVSKARFDGENNSLVNAQNGTTANLPCIILNRDDHETVSWIRSRDHHLITVGRQTYSSDDRFSVTFNRHLNKWTLHLRYVQPRDAGQYICQLSTDPVMVYVVRLSVTEASSTIRGGPERYVHEGSSVRLECTLQRHTQAPEYVFWYHNRSMINYDVNRKVKVESTPDGSVLTLLSVGRTDSGNYTCSPANAQQASITLHIILGDTLAAMKVSGTPRSPSPNRVHHLLLALLLPLLPSLLRGVVCAPFNLSPCL